MKSGNIFFFKEHVRPKYDKPMTRDNVIFNYIILYTPLMSLHLTFSFEKCYMYYSPLMAPQLPPHFFFILYTPFMTPSLFFIFYIRLMAPQSPLHFFHIILPLHFFLYFISPRWPIDLKKTFTRLIFDNPIFLEENEIKICLLKGLRKFVI